ncbi:MAG: DUF1573 domain-containing protein [Candidatus Woesearchaeota archaeon]|nr:DUF1573 domain-containing protein [Candidatus Woesearchaeota archaeon]
MGVILLQKNTHLYTYASLFIAVLILILVVYHDAEKDAELEKIYSTFTCNCCDTTLTAADTLCASGFKEEIQQLQDTGLRKQALFHAATRLLGINNIISPELRLETFEHFQAHPEEQGARVHTRETTVDLGDVSEQNTSFVFKDFSIKNTGTEDLLIHQVETTCSCLSVHFLTKDWESPTYGRFSDLFGLLVTIPPGKEIRMRVKYDTRINSFFRGYEKRHVRVHTNDVLQPLTQFDIEAVHTD